MFSNSLKKYVIFSNSLKKLVIKKRNFLLTGSYKKIKINKALW